jgi:hypothetical protein
MQTNTRNLIAGSSLMAASLLLAQATVADTVSEALANGTSTGDFRLRFESVDQNNALKDAEALTLRSRISYTTGTVSNMSATVEFEDVRIVGGIGDYNNPVDGRPGYSVVADPEQTEIDQAFVQYKTDQFTARYGRQVLTLDNHRFTGHVGWRQDRQTFDAFSAKYTGVENLTATYAYLLKRNRIFGDELDIQSKDHLLNASYKTAIGTVTAYGYFLEEDKVGEKAFNTLGLRYTGSADFSATHVSYTAEFATQKKDDALGADFDADYWLLEAGVSGSGMTAKLGYEVLGSDGGQYGFSTPLATLHAFNGWTDSFLGTPNEGLVDLYVSVGGKLGGGKLSVVYHDFKADEASATVDKLGREYGIVYSRKFGKNYTAGIKYASYKAGDIKVDTDKLWVWVGAKF